MAKESWRLGPDKESWHMPLEGSKGGTESGKDEAVVRRRGSEFDVLLGNEVQYTTNSLTRAKKWAETYRVRGAEGMLQWR